VSARESELQQEHRPAGGQQAEPDAAPTTHHSSSAAVAAAMRLQHGAGNRAAAARLSRAPAAGSTPMRTPAPAAKPAAKPAAGGAPAAGAKAAVPGELAKACEQLYTALNIGGLSSAKTEQILHTLDVNKAQGKALAAAYATTYGGRSLDADLRKLSDANYVRARDYVWFGGLRTMTKVLIAVAGAGTDTKTLMRLLEQVARERGSVGKPTDLWDALRKDANNPLGQRFRGEELEAMLNSQLDGTDVVRAKVLVTQGELKPIDKIFLALTQVGTDEDLLFEGLAAANPTTIRQEFKSYKFRPRPSLRRAGLRRCRPG
jgi:hypothetical protein